MNNKKNYDHHQLSLQQNKSQSPKKKNRLKSIILVVFMIAIIVLLILIHVNQYVKLARRNFKIESLKEKINQLKSEKAHLQLKISRLISLDRIERIAKQELNMKEPENVNYIVLNQTKDDKNMKLSSQKSQKEDNQKPNRGIKEKVLAWFNKLTNVQADTLE
ncbi:cell division protein FtsL [Halobacteroides halobius]|nr:cell division protein FtsL [Halobacteroides halobius]